MDDDRIITNAMLRAQDQGRIAALTDLLRECLTSIDRVNDWELQERIEAALGKEG